MAYFMLSTTKLHTLKERNRHFNVKTRTDNETVTQIFLIHIRKYYMKESKNAYSVSHTYD